MIFSAGLGRYATNESIPKPLIKINNKSLLKNNIEKLIESKFRNIVVNAYIIQEKLLKKQNV